MAVSLKNLYDRDELLFIPDRTGHFLWRRLSRSLPLVVSFTDRISFFFSSQSLNEKKVKRRRKTTTGALPIFVWCPIIKMEDVFFLHLIFISFDSLGDLSTNGGMAV